MSWSINGSYGILAKDKIHIYISIDIHSHSHSQCQGHKTNKQVKPKIRALMKVTVSHSQKP